MIDKVINCNRNLALFQPKADGERKLYDSLGHLYKDFDVYQHYGVDKYLSCVGLSVSEKYRGRGIGLRLLQARLDKYAFIDA